MLLIEEDGIGWRCSACGYFHRGDSLLGRDKPPVSCEDCGVKFDEYSSAWTSMDTNTA